MKVFLLACCVILTTSSPLSFPMTSSFINPFDKLSSILSKLLNYKGKGEQGRSAALTNICVYSDDPAQFQPKCFPCPNSVYENVVQACSEQENITDNGNVTYSQANCVEQNCKINSAKRAVRERRAAQDENSHDNFANSDDDDSMIIIEVIPEYEDAISTPQVRNADSSVHRIDFGIQIQ